jgi:hypothetical protein
LLFCSSGASSTKQEINMHTHTHIKFVLLSSLASISFRNICIGHSIFFFSFYFFIYFQIPKCNQKTFFYYCVFLFAYKREIERFIFMVGSKWWFFPCLIRDEVDCSELWKKLNRRNRQKIISWKSCWKMREQKIWKKVIEKLKCEIIVIAHTHSFHSNRLIDCCHQFNFLFTFLFGFHNFYFTSSDVQFWEPSDLSSFPLPKPRPTIKCHTRCKKNKNFFNCGQNKAEQKQLFLN